MIQEEKSLLLQDLCARLPYGVLCKLKNEILPLKDVFIEGVVGNKGQLGFGTNKYGRIFQEIDEIKPYLRPMGSMTEEEKIELCIRAYAPDEMKTLDEKLYVIQTNANNAADFYNNYCFIKGKDGGLSKPTPITDEQIQVLFRTSVLLHGRRF